MAWHIIEDQPGNLDSAMQSFEDQASTSSIDSFSVAYNGHNRVTVLIEYTEA